MENNAENTAALAAEIARLRRVPQRPPSVFEAAAYAILFFLMVAAGAMPSSALFFMPAILPLLYLLFRRFGAYLPFACICFYGLFALVCNYDILSVVYFVFLAAAFCGLLAAVQLKDALLCAAVAAVCAILGAFAGVGIVRLAEARPIGEIAERYVLAERDDPVISFLAHRLYPDIRVADGTPKPAPGEPGYEDAVADAFSQYANNDISGYIAYYCVHYGAVFAVVAYLIATVINRRTASAYDFDMTEQVVGLSTRCLGGVRRESKSIAQMQVPRAFLWTVLLPGLAASVFLDIAGGYSELSATIMHAFVTLPAAFGFFTLAAYFASLFTGKGSVAAHIVLCLIGAAMVVVPIWLFVCSMIGICDAIFNLRYWSELLRRDG